MKQADELLDDKDREIARLTDENNRFRRALFGTFIPENARSSDEVYSLLKTEQNRPAWEKRNDQ